MNHEISMDNATPWDETSEFQEFQEFQFVAEPTGTPAGTPVESLRLESRAGKTPTKLLIK